jgi:DNA-binding transcriptional ArsR family regulator
MVVLLQALAHPVRLRLVATLCEREVEVNALAAALGVSQPIVSQQLRILRMARLVSVKREGGRARYRLAHPTLRELVQSLARCCGGPH